MVSITNPCLARCNEASSPSPSAVPPKACRSANFLASAFSTLSPEVLAANSRASSALTMPSPKSPMASPPSAKLYSRNSNGYGPALTRFTTLLASAKSISIIPRCAPDLAPSPSARTERTATTLRGGVPMVTSYNSKPAYLRGESRRMVVMARGLGLEM